MKRGFYWHLAFSNLKRGKQAQIPYLISCAVMIALLYIVHSLAAVSNPALVSGGRYTMEMMKQGGRIFSLLAALFLFYTNSFIIKRRKKELGLYHILGLEKRQVCRILQYENLFSKMVVLK